ISRTLKISENSSVILKETVNEVGFNFHFGIRAATSLNNYFYLGPKLTVIDNTTSFSIVAGFGFGKNETDKTRDSGKDFRTTTELDDLIGNVEFSQLPNFRAAVPKSKSYSDEEILELFRKKYPNLGSRSDEELILLIEKKYGPK
ncbi:MAG: hypothetical protein KDC84_16300, partial [Crocinitomicaceae bacterium]|nr:hypothetical protein [Crocinitomicaceae bacterium]